MRITWLSNAVWARTGYGQQTDLFWWRIQKLGHQVTLAANWGLNGSPLNIESHGEKTVVLPSGFNVHGTDVLIPYARQTKADIVITLYDAWVFDPRITSQFRWCPWAPVDHDPLPEAVQQALQPAWQPIAYSKFGLAKMKEAGFANALYVPHGIDTHVFQPIPKAEARKLCPLPGMDESTFLIVSVAANKGTPSRKSFPEMMAAYAEFRQKHPNSLLYMHTNATQEAQGLDLSLLIRKCGLPPEAVVMPDKYRLVQGYPPEFLATLYSAADVLLSPSQGEGFGVPIVEAQACGCPVIVGNWTSMPELCFAGRKVGGQKFWTPQGAWQFIPRIDEITDALEWAYDMRTWPKLRKDAREGAMQYDADKVTAEYWKPVLAELEAEISEAKSGDDLLQMVDLGEAGR